MEPDLAAARPWPAPAGRGRPAAAGRLRRLGGDTSSPGPATTRAGPAGAGSARRRPGLVAAADVPVGGGTIFADAEGRGHPARRRATFKAFSAICTHQGCPVTKVADGTIDCPCHGSPFSIEDGSVQGGPAPSPLPGESVTVKGGEIVRA